MIIPVIQITGATEFVMLENICTISPPTSTDPPGTATTIIMTNGYRVCVQDTMAAIVDLIRGIEDDRP